MNVYAWTMGRSAASWAVLLFGCTCCDYGSLRPGDSGDDQDTDIVEATIQAGGRLADVVGGEGAGVFIEYVSDGAWTVTLGCDSALSGVPCEWDLRVSPLGEEELSVATQQMDHEDWIVEDGHGGIEVYTTTALELDRMSMQAEAGAPLRFAVWLDARFLDRDAAPQRFVYWVGEPGILHAGAPSRFLDLLPTEP
jgi:hypothetical protein